MQPEVMTTVTVGALLAVFTAVLSWQGKGRFDVLAKAISEMRSELKDVRTELKDVRTEFKDVRTELKDTRLELKAETAQIRAELVSIHATITQVALAVRPQPRPEAG